MWADGSRLESGRVGAAWAWWQEGEWRGDGSSIGTNEVFDAEVYALLEAIRLLNDRGETDANYTVFSDSQAAIFRLLHEECGPAQALARAAIEASQELRARGNDITIRWTPSHRGVAGNEKADALARQAAAGGLRQASPTYLREASLAHLTRKITEARSLETSSWIRAHVKRRHRYRPPPGGKMRQRHPASGEWAKHPVTSAGGAAPARYRQDCTSSAVARGGLPRSRSYGAG